MATVAAWVVVMVLVLLLLVCVKQSKVLNWQFFDVLRYQLQSYPAGTNTQTNTHTQHCHNNARQCTNKTLTVSPTFNTTKAKWQKFILRSMSNPCNYHQRYYYYYYY